MQCCSYPFSTNNCWEDLTAVLKADVESPISGHPRDEGDEDADLGIRVSHLQFFFISLLFQAGIYARHTKEQE